MTKNIKLSKPEQLTNSIIQQLGRDYQSTFGKEPGCLGIIFHLFFTNSNHRMAKEMVEYDKNNSYIDKWNYLVNLYQDLPSNNGPLANNIRDLFAKAFGMEVQRWEEAQKNTFQELTPGNVADKLRDQVRNYKIQVSRNSVHNAAEFEAEDQQPHSESTRLI